MSTHIYVAKIPKLQKQEHHITLAKVLNASAWSTIRSVKMPKDKRYIIIVAHCLTEISALAIERRLIEWYGRKDNNTGILHNRTAGGDGVTDCHKGKPWSDARRAAYEANKDKPRKSHSAETEAKIAAANKGRTVSDEWRKQHSAVMSGRKKWTNVRRNKI